MDELIPEQLEELKKMETVLDNVDFRAILEEVPMTRDEMAGYYDGRQAMKRLRCFFGKMGFKVIEDK